MSFFKEERQRIERQRANFAAARNMLNLNQDQLYWQAQRQQLLARIESQRLLALERQNARLQPQPQPQPSEEDAFVASHPQTPLNQIPTCRNDRDYITLDDINISDNEQDVVIILNEENNRTYGQCYLRPNFVVWWNTSDPLTGRKMGQQMVQDSTGQYDIFSLAYPRDTYITEKSVQILLQSPAKVFRLVFWKDVRYGGRRFRLNVLIPVPVQQN
jgi:hypothetical protein